LSAAGHTAFSKLAELCENLAVTPGRNDKKRLISSFLKQLRPEEVSPAVLLIVGTVFPEQDSKPLDVGYQLVSKSIRRSGQLRLLDRRLTVLDVRNTFEAMADSSGKRSRQKKEELFASLMGRATELERKWIVKNVFGEMQHGVGEGLMLDAIAGAAALDVATVRRVHMFLGDLGKTAHLALTRDKKELRLVGLSLFRPVKPMLAEMAYSIKDVFDNIRPPIAFEFKFDGARVQIHESRGRVMVFSRRLSNVTDSIPEVVELIKENVKSSTSVFDGELIAVSGDGRPLPFQDLMRRFRRIRGVEEAREQVPVKLYLFDMLYDDGKLLVDLPYLRRWEILLARRGSIDVAPRIMTSSVEEAERFMKRSLDAGHEGLMAKDLSSQYQPGSRGKKWFKIKSAETLDLVIVAADWGYGRRTGWLSNYHLAALDELTGQFEVVGKTFKGLTDSEFEWMTRKLQELKVSEDEHTVHVRPEVVVEVAFGEVQKSPRYRSGAALRFARITKIREDKSPAEADTIERVRALHEKQFKAKGRLEAEFK
jgi:DNA ligase-1